jgi:hypothetical protein
MQFKVLVNLVLIAVSSVLGAKMESHTQVDGTGPVQAEPKQQEVSEAQAMSAKEINLCKQLLMSKKGIANLMSEKGMLEIRRGTVGSSVYAWIWSNIFGSSEEPEEFKEAQWHKFKALLKEFASVIQKIVHPDIPSSDSGHVDRKKVTREILVKIEEKDIPNLQQQMKDDPAFKDFPMMKIAIAFVKQVLKENELDEDGFKQLLDRIAQAMQHGDRSIVDAIEYIKVSTGRDEDHPGSSVYSWFFDQDTVGVEPQYLKGDQWKKSKDLLYKFARIIEGVVHPDIPSSCSGEVDVQDETKKILDRIKNEDIPNLREQMKEDPAFKDCRLLEIANEFVEKKRKQNENYVHYTARMSLPLSMTRCPPSVCAKSNKIESTGSSKGVELILPNHGPTTWIDADGAPLNSSSSRIVLSDTTSVKVIQLECVENN